MAEPTIPGETILAGGFPLSCSSRYSLLRVLGTGRTASVIRKFHTALE